MTIEKVHVNLAARSYEIHIQKGCLRHAGATAGTWLSDASSQLLRALVISDDVVWKLHGSTVMDSLAGAGIESISQTVPSGETSKSYQQVQRLYDTLVDMAADRKTIVIAMGGGVVGDLAGFVAATYARGLRFVQIPTTLLAMVDSSVGGKTGINHPKGKNLIGAFHQPSGVLIDTELLKTLPDREYRSGLAEIVKYGVIMDEPFLQYLEQNITGLNERRDEVMGHVVARSCQLKAQVVEEDEFETTGLRAILNYGHTFAHAFEALAGYGTLLHGEAVSIGMVCASRLAESLGRISNQDTQRQISLLQALSLPVHVPADLAGRTDEIVRCMMLDKKTEGRELRFILPSAMGHVETVRGIDAGQAITALG
ncbi:MAG: 3-dehydroquinate synthase [Planctomycetaceae bacterium]